MKYITVLAIALALLTGCKTTQELKPVSEIKAGFSREGSLANQQLISDATAGLQEITGAPVKSADVLKFVIQQPVGDIGSRTWREMWIMKTSDSTTQFLLTFKEAGLDAADFEIATTDNALSDTQCPDNVAKFPVGETTSEDVVSCMGKPQHEDYNPDGRFVYIYDTPQEIILSYLFGENKKLIKIAAYEKTNH
ncbi:hypothetical protein [Endozoicomonas elysicola]|uniref:hypothetical protein n=1 Tax=Endozoicomonas elysicola TaxID=305900 RepID=UPI00035CC285|nr:hypothetical protein [Endozoicomonas elysicola]